MSESRGKFGTIDNETAADQLKKKEKVAQDYLDNPEKLRKLIEEGAKKANSIKGPFDELANMLKVLFSLTKDWINGSYRVVPVGSIIVIVAALIYFLSPVDLIPDILPIVGLSDDVVVVALAYKQVKSDIEKYKVWKGME
ncbi:MAG: DUF1232 domain-containing protein [Acidaminobacter sp.]|uniref:YkvA family protein n=1 Tax=Acidaminobacter sp. TaxID=1872102 RepID=UPI00137CB3E2|nr:YkvA family protein [Acidaminobacter sp.]MZQ99681.1 DUF1232 domain-containing protein [Acidaminobacter sp.]